MIPLISIFRSEIEFLQVLTLCRVGAGENKGRSGVLIFLYCLTYLTSFMQGYVNKMHVCVCTYFLFTCFPLFGCLVCFVCLLVVLILFIFIFLF